jgi:tape measure domain-containing protein
MAAPELRLDVRLNLATFRNDLGKAAQTAASYYYPINLLINKQNLTKQLTAIGRSLGTTKYNIDLNDTSVDLAAGKIDKLAASLKKLSGSIQIDFNAGGGTKPIGTAMKEMAAKLAKESKGDIDKAVARMVEMRGGSPTGSSYRSIPGFKSAAKISGIEDAFKLFFQELNQVDPQGLKKALDDGSVMMMQENRELKQKLDKVQSSAESAAQDLRTMGETVAAAGGKFKASLATGGKTLYPQNYGLKIASLLSQVEKLDKDLRQLSPLAGAEVASELADLNKSLKGLSNSFLGLTGISESLDDTLGNFQRMVRAASAATSAYTERIMRRGGMEIASQSQRLLPSAPSLAGLLPGAKPLLSPQEREAAARARGDVEFGPRTAGEIRPIALTGDPRVTIFERLLEQRDERDKAVFAELAKLRDAASRTLPPGVVAQVGTTAQDQAVRSFYRALREGAIRIQKATQQLLTGTQLSGLLPSREMVDQRKFAAAIQKAVAIDMQNALQFEAQKKMLPAAGETAFAANMRQSLQGSVFRAPATGGRGDATREELQERERSVRVAQARRRSEERSAQILEADDRRRASIRALLDAETAQELRDAASRRQSFRESAGRLLPAGVPAIADQGAQSAVVEQFYTSMRVAQQMLERNFSANSYLPQATRALAASMMQASASIKALPAARGAKGALPSAEMMETLRFQRAMAKSVQVDMDNALRQQMQGRMLPSAGQTSYRSPEQIARQAEQQASAEVAAKDARAQAGEMIRAVRAELRTPLLSPGITYPSSPLGSMGQFPVSGMAGRGSMGQFPMDPQLAVGGASAMGQKIAGPYPWSNTLASARGGYIRGIRSSAQFPMEGMVGPPSPLEGQQSSYQHLQAGRITAQSSMFARKPGGGGAVPPGGFPVDDVMVTRNAKLGTVMDVAAASTRNFTASQIPLIGGLKNLAGEFSQAAKQVLLYGTAYKGLAFLTSLPGQILNAAKSQQQFANGLKVATQDTGTFAKELLYVDNVQRAFGLNLETTRTGFTRLYASMAPTGFDSGSIEKLFTGISAATASLQLTPDKAERVIYAFGQMASKGQIMAEELKGQLGDVLPGALAIFSKAAGMSVKEFSKAMEDGEFTGNRFREVLAKVSDELMNRFGTGAQAAGRSLQGLINTVGGDFTRTLQSFAPLANAAAQATLGPLTGILRKVSMAAQIAMGEQDRVKKQLEAAQADVSALKTGGADVKEIKAAEQNVAALAAQYEVLNEAAKDPAIAQQVKNIEAFVIEIQKAATFTMNLAGVIGNVLSPVFTFLGGNLTSVIGNLALFALGFNAVKLAALLFTGTLATLNAIQKANGSISVIAAAKSTILAGVYRLVGVQATGAQVATVGFSLAVKGLLASTGIGLLVVLLGSLATAFLSVGNKAKEAADRAKRSIDSMVDAARTGNVSLIENELALNKADRQDLENFIKDVEGVTGKKSLTRGGGTVETITLTPAQRREAKRLGAEIGDVVTKGSLLSSLKGQRAPLKEVETEGKDELAFARRRIEQLGLNQPTPGATTPEDPSTGKPLKEQSLESYYSLQDQLAKAQTQADIDRIEALFNHRKELINNLYDLEETRANSIQKEAIAHQRAISNIFLDLQKKQIDARLSVMKAEGSVAGGAPTGSGGSLAGMTQYITGDPSHPSYKPDHGTIENYHDHLAFASREAAIEAYNKLTKSGIQVTEFQGFGQGVTGPHSGPGSAHHQGLAMDVRGAQWGGSGAIGEREFAGSARVRATLGMGGSVGATPGKVTPDTKRDVLAEQAKLLAGKQAAISLTHAEVEAQQKLVIETEKYLAQIFGIAEKELQTSMLQKKTAMLRAGATDQEIEDAMSLEEINLKYTAGVDAANKQIATNNKLIAEGSGDKDLLNKNTAAQVRLIGKLNEELPKAIKAQTDLNEAQKDAPFSQRIRDLKEEIKLLLIVNDAERRLAELRNEYNGDAAKAQQVFNLEEVKKNIEATRALIDDFVSSTASDYKGFLKAVISGEDAVDALKQFQAGLTDKVLTIFLDFTMAPVEKFFKESLLGFLNPKVDPKLLEQEKSVNALTANTTELKNLTTAIKGMGAGTNATSSIQDPTAGNAFSDGSALPPIAPGFDAASVFGNPEALTGAFGGVQASISESMNGIVSSFENGASSLGNALPAWDTA